MYEKSDADILAESREYLETNGWWRGRVFGPNGRQVCGMGAVGMSQGWLQGDNVRKEHGRDMNRILHKVLMAVSPIYKLELESHATSRFVAWNDKQVLDKQTLLDAFMKAEKIERNGNA